MVNNSEKVYKFNWMQAPCLVTNPCVGYISPGEEKDIEIMFYSAEPVTIIRVGQIYKNYVWYPSTYTGIRAVMDIAIIALPVQTD